MNDGSDPIRRAAGVILWHLEHTDPATGQPNTPESAMAKAWSRQPQLTEAQIRYALGWAQAGRRFRDMMQACRSACEVVNVPFSDRKVAVPKPGTSQPTLQDVMDASGLSAFRDRANYPPDGD